MSKKIYGLMLGFAIVTSGFASRLSVSTDSGILYSPPESEISGGETQCILPENGISLKSIKADSFSKIPYSWTFTSDTDFHGWTLGEDTSVSSSGIRAKSSGVVSPEINLTGYSIPVLMYAYDLKFNNLDFISKDSPYNYVYVSRDGENWINIHGCILPKWVKYVRIHKTSFAKISIVDITSDSEWQHLVDAKVTGGIPEEMIVDCNRDGILDGLSRDGKILYESAGKGYIRLVLESPVTNLRFSPDYSFLIGNHSGYYKNSGLVSIGMNDFKEKGSIQDSYYYPLDADNNGVTTEYFMPENNTLYMLEKDGTFSPGVLPVVSINSLIAENDDDSENEGRAFVAWDYSMLSPSYIGSQMFGRDGGSGSIGSLDGGEFRSIDVNGNGLTDHINFNNGKVYFNLGNGKFCEESFNGMMHFADFNGDGREDYVLYNGSDLSLNIVTADGNVESKKIISGYKCTNVWTRDVDNDGDPDLVLSLESTQKFIVVLENTGNGNFSRRENVPKDVVGKFTACVDYDNDGCYEVITDHGTAYKLNGYKLDTSPVCLVEDNSSETIHFINPSNGIFHIAKSNDTGFTVYNSTPNSRPQSPSEAPSLTGEPSTGLLKISWQQGRDKETPVQDLTYSLRIGSAPGLDDILPAYASPDGIRYEATEGNCNRATSRIINTSGWPAGKYYVSIQTVDGNYCGSDFSKEAVFEKSTPACNFTLDYKPNVGIHTPIDIRLGSVPASGEICNWDFDGGQKVYSNSDGTHIKVIFTTPGEKNISLFVTSASGETSRTVTHPIEIFPTSVKNDGLIMWFSDSDYDKNGNGLACFTTAFDIDEDGIAETYTGRWRSLFMKGEQDGTYRPVERMFNSHTYVGYFRDYKLATVDLDGDGMCDIVSPDFSNRYSKLYYGYNLGDLDMDFEMESGNGLNNLYIQEWLDFDNDGAYDVFGNGYLWRNDGTYKNFLSKKLAMDNSTVFADCDGDGLIDAVMGNTVYYNKGDFTFHSPQTLTGVSGGKVLFIRDFDNNGDVDFLFTKGHELWILWDDNSVSQLGVNSDYVTTVRDINNDGYPDMLLTNYIVTMHPGRRWTVYDSETIEKDIDGIEYDTFGKCFKGSDANIYTISDRYQNGYYSTTHPDIMQVNIPNESPLPPTGIRHTQNESFVVIEWEHSEDKETPAPQMQYNISIRKKGASGKGAYLFSPANSGKNGVPVPTHKPLVRGNRFSIPVANIPAGVYEVMIQGVDAFNSQSDFSEVYEMTVAESANIEMQPSGEVNVPVKIKILVNVQSDIDFDGGTVTEYASGIYTVVWNTTGKKTINVNGVKSEIIIQDAPDGKFTLPAEARIGDRIRIPAIQADKGRWSAIERIWAPGWEDVEVNLLEKNKYFDFNIVSPSEVIAIPLSSSSTALHHFVSSRFSTQQYSGSFTIPEKPETKSTPTIDYVTADATTGKYKIQWTNPDRIRTEATGINVYKESNIAGKYILLASLPLTATEYVDMTSNPDMMASRYVMTYNLTFGESGDSKAHQSIHVMINRGAGSSWNLIWGKYEGSVIPQYRILRGSSPESLAVIAEVSGNLTSYTDFTAPSTGALYYAVESVIEPDYENTPLKQRAVSTRNARSNVIAAAGSNINFAQSISIYTDDNTNISYKENGANKIQLHAIINPLSATFGRVNWIVTSGEEVATVDQTGCVVATGKVNGTATIRAQSIDGSGVYGEIDVTVSGATGIDTPNNDTSKSEISVYPSPAIDKFSISGLTQGSDIRVFSLGGAIVLSQTDWKGDETGTFDCSHWADGIYIVSVYNHRSVTTSTQKIIKVQ